MPRPTGSGNAAQEDLAAYNIFDFCVDAELRSAPDILGTPGAQNSVFTANPPPAVRDVNHTPKAPKSWESTLVSARIPAQPHRTLVRSRTVATDIPGASVTVPTADDPRKNYAFYVYNAVPIYTVGTQVFAPDTLNTPPVYQCQGAFQRNSIRYRFVTIPLLCGNYARRAGRGSLSSAGVSIAVILPARTAAHT